MRIAFIFDALLYGGIERVGISYLKFLEQDGHDVDVFVLNTKDIEGIINEIPSKFKIHKYYVSPYMCPGRYWYLIKRWSWGILLFPFAYSIVYLFIHIYGLWFKKFGKYDLAISMAGHYNDLTVNAYNLIRSEKKVCWLHGGLYQYMIMSPAYERLYTKIKNIITLNDLVLSECFFFNKHLKINSKTIYNPCFIKDRPLDQNKIKEIKQKYGDFILMACRMTDQKHPVGLIKAMEYINDKYGIKYNLVFVGDGEKKDEFEKYASSTRINDHIFFVGNQTDPQNYYASAKIFGFSSFNEGLPTVIVEAMNFGLPIATSDTSVREVLKDGAYGLISPVDDEVGLGENLYRLISDPQEYEKFSRLSLERANDFSPEKIKKQFNDYISQLW